ncbi:hypothetical protein CkaCkLH20_00612 [Colletotrichum karsti]|uniref:Uncharacterized protein n=1 Tax=Colletotrichum karsti TaxID=1095194 RepID=A0A9P6II42_9PEZI|nr:uncharacterized protein CkaCkLH20_00612 [Colletotrichum karsti]KAF9881466.1 hypothetical protein CkaCkLH20_00612 [Colletotrichum karsti]
MASSSTMWPKAFSKPMPTITSRYLLRQQASAQVITHRPFGAPFTITPPQLRLQTHAFSQRHLTSFSMRPVPQEPPPKSISGEDWEALSPEAKIQWLGDDKWGWVVYRCSYAKEFDGAWGDLKRRITQGMRGAIARSDAPYIAQTMDFVFVEDPLLEGASVHELRRRFQTWARENNTTSIDMEDEKQGSRGSRYEFFLRVDGEGLWNGYVGLVRGWPCSPGSEDWMKIRAGAVAPALYIMLDDPEVWYAYYTPPEIGVCGAL